MNTNLNNKNTAHNSSCRSAERRAMIFVTIVLCLGFFTLFNNLQKPFNKAESGYKDNSVVYLNKDVNVKELSDLLIDGNYVLDEKDAAFIAQHIKEKLNEGVELPNLGELNKRTFSIPAILADSLGGSGLKLRVDSSYAILGITDDVITKYSNLNTVRKKLDLKNGNYSMKVIVQEPDTTLKGINKYVKKAFRKDQLAVAGVLIRLKEHYYNTYFDEKKKESSTVYGDSIVGYAITDSNGLAVFTGLNGDGYYSVLPVKKGFEYGASKGTTKGALKEMKSGGSVFKFLQREHKITPFDMLTYQQIKEDTALTVRTPSQFKNDLIVWIALFFIFWWCLSFFLRSRKIKKDRKEVDPLLLPLLMILSGIGVLMMYSITNPLTDTLLGNDMAKGVITGIITIACISQIDFAKFSNSQYKWLDFDFLFQLLSWIAKPFGEKIRQEQHVTKENLGSYRLKLIIKVIMAVCCLPFELLFRGALWLVKPFENEKNLLFRRIRIVSAIVFFPIELLLRFIIRPLFKIEGVGYCILAFVLIGLLELFGSGPEGSNAKVNLFFFQPSEITKYLIVVFLAAFFKHNADKIKKYSEEFDWNHIKSQSKTVLMVIGGLLGLLGCYFILGDMGPALVLAVTFIIIYSVVRGDFLQLLAGTLSFILFLWIGSKLQNSQQVLAIFALLWIIFWLGYGLGKPRKQLYESAIFLNLVIAAFIFGGSIFNSIGLSGQAQRLNDRVEICLGGIWDNEVRGGDQVVQGLWSAASGGFTGQGLGEGNPNLTPAFHTDMIFTSIGEEMGWIGLALIILSIAILIHRSLHIGYKSGNPFLFYLATGIAVITGIQFLTITLGSTGLIPLTGVAVPFLSFGKTSLIINLAAFGVLFSISKNKATDLQIDDFKNNKKYDKIIGVGSFTYYIISVVLLICLAWYQGFAQDKILIRPALVTNQQGERVAEYNPRINLLMKELHAGNIYDRNGLILATNDTSMIRKEIADGDKFVNAGADKAIYTKELKQHKQRYYPFGNNLLFWLGDFNNKILWNDNDNDPHGYIAEHRYLAALRGFDNLKDKEKHKIPKSELTAKKYRGSPFIYPIEKKTEYTPYNYSALLPMLKEGLHSRSVDNWNKNSVNYDITLTVDAALQTKIQNEIQAYAGQNLKVLGNKLRISVVVLDAKSGDMLCSANYPLPQLDMLRYKPVYKESNLKENAYADRDLGMTFQTPPGSTAKVMSALAGLQKMGSTATGKKYFIYPKEIIENGNAKEPNNQIVTMEDAIVLSSNCYFINFVNNNDLYQNLDSIYSTVGIRIDKKFTTAINGEAKERSKYMTPYYLEYSQQTKEYKDEIETVGKKAVKLYDDYIAKRDKNKIYEQMSHNHNGHDWNDCAWAWGQGTMSATPLNMAHVASIVVNGGEFVPTQFVLKGNNDKTVVRPTNNSIPIVSKEEADILKGYMTTESMKEQARRNKVNFTSSIGGKTGTPERDFYYSVKNNEGKIEFKKDPRTWNDGWYVFFTNSEKPLAVAVRMERLASGYGGSGTAVRLTDKVVMKVLTDLGYVETNQK